jgi:hypothetical protein
MIQLRILMCRMVYWFSSKILNWCITKKYWKLAELMVKWRVEIVERFYELTKGTNKLPNG